MAKPENDPIKKLGEKLNEMMNKEKLSRKNLKPTSSEPSIAQLVTEGNTLLDEETKSTATEKKSDTVPEAELKVNPYYAARLIVLKRMDAWHRNEVLRMEQEKNKDNRFYDDFVIQQRIEGDRLSA
jgi:hypothetical protein